LDTKKLPGTFHSTIPSFHHPIIPSQGTLDRQHLIRTCFVDFDRSIVLVAEVDKAIMGAGRISREEMSDDFTFSLQVLPECRKKGGMAKGLRGGSCAVEVGDWRDWWPLFDFFLKLDNNSIHNIYIIDWEYIAVSNQQYDTRFGSWWRWATSKQVSKNGCMLIPSGVGAMWLANNSNIYM
jgi:hypothetical protein